MPGPLPPLAPAEPCQTWSGVFFVRRCGRPAVARCLRCGRAACQEHLRPAPAGPAAGPAPGFVCLACLHAAVERGAPDFRRDGGSETSSGGSTAGGTGWSGGGGAFSGGGASGRWDGAPARTVAGAAAAGAVAGTAVTGADPVFTEADYAAFAAMSEADKDEGGPSYDS